MIKLFIKSIGKTIDINPGLFQIVIEDSLLYRNIAVNLESEMTLSFDNKITSFEKSAIAIYDPFNIDLNDSKSIKALYKVLEREINEAYGNELHVIENLLFDMSEKLILSSNANIDYEPQIDISKLLACFGVKYVVFEDYLLNLIQFIKIQHELLSKKFILFFGLSTILSENEQKSLNQELNINGFSVIDISYYPKKSNTINSLIIDEDWCIL